MARRRFFATHLGAGAARIEGAGAAHLARVLRAQVGQEYELAHAGQIYLGRVVAVDPRTVCFSIVAPLPSPPPTPGRELAVALFKFDRFEWVLEKATELGLTRLHPLLTRRTDPHLQAAAPKRLDRWRTLVLEAAQQSRRSEVPEILPPQALERFLAEPPPGRRVLLSEDPGGEDLTPTPAPLLLLTGPEGGWTPEEQAAARAAGFIPASLGPRILRCETAILAALARTLEMGTA